MPALSARPRRDQIHHPDLKLDTRADERRHSAGDYLLQLRYRRG
jgi:hypothetical protein